MTSILLKCTYYSLTEGRKNKPTPAVAVSSNIMIPQSHLYSCQKWTRSYQDRAPGFSSPPHWLQSLGVEILMGSF